ncbi:hypothetical protein LEP1GSC158_4960 [Leptospira interrogans serovar Zanoni str. LT2156]|uniref:Uncharacterized protein n=1 Tax=Leptospira interrogans serovar Zanoni str. LT2156 TaxID=1001601 RepID=M6HRU9_LEPIR|nr:hypothetical protein LEP1GSC158_4960 [Leptospira interrogans serovar Zanoni str. LT2156]
MQVFNKKREVMAPIKPFPSVIFYTLQTVLYVVRFCMSSRRNCRI